MISIPDFLYLLVETCTKFRISCKKLFYKLLLYVGPVVTSLKHVYHRLSHSRISIEIYHHLGELESPAPRLIVKYIFEIFGQTCILFVNNMIKYRNLYLIFTKSHSIFI